MERIPFYSLYGETESNNELDFFHIESDVERSRDSELEWEVRPHRHENLHQFLYLEEGCFTLNMDEVQKVANAPCLVSIPSLVVHSAHLASGSGRYVLTIRDSYISSLFSENESLVVNRLLSQPVLIKLEDNSQLSDQIQSLVKMIYREYYGHMDGRASLISAFIKTLVIQLGRLIEIEDESDSENPQNINIYNLFRNSVEEHFRDHWEVREYAGFIGVSEDRLNGICKRIIKHSPSQIIHNRLLMEAKRHLAYTNKTISTIAYELGFSDPSYFSRFFRKNTGETASSFKARFIKLK